MTMSMSRKNNMLLQIETCENFVDLLVFPFKLSRCKLKSPNIYKFSCSEKLCSPVDLEIHQKIDMYRFEAYTGRQQNH